MKAFLDTNVILDYFQKRPGYEEAKRIFKHEDKFDDRRIYVSYLSVANAAFVLRKTHNNESLKNLFKDFMRFCEILPMNDAQIYEVCRSGSSPDFEDNLQIMCAEYGNCDVIVTSNVDHFRAHTNIPVLSPEDFVGHFGK